jgi:hypothetical protein
MVYQSPMDTDGSAKIKKAVKSGDKPGTHAEFYRRLGNKPCAG